VCARTSCCGVDSSTPVRKVSSSTTPAGSAKVRRRIRGQEVDPASWQEAFTAACRNDLLAGVAAISVAGQQLRHGRLDGDGGVVRPAILWNDAVCP
jgi:xylulokinase